MKKTVIIYPLPCDSKEVYDLFLPCIERFSRTFKEFPPGCEYELQVVANPCISMADIPSSIYGHVSSLLEGTNFVWKTYEGGGADLGAAQAMSLLNRDCFQVNLTSRCYFHRERWLKQLVDARQAHGPGLYGCTISREGAKQEYICTRGYCYDADDFRNFPVTLDSRDKGVWFECGDGCVTEWFKAHQRPVFVVYWTGVCGPDIWWEQPCSFRMSDQSNCLLFDRHTLLYEEGSPSRKLELEAKLSGE